MVVLSVVCHGRAVPLLWKALNHSRASVSADVVNTLLERTNRLLSELSGITMLADRAFLSAELLGWFVSRPCCLYMMKLRAETWIHRTTAPMDCEVRRLRLPVCRYRGFGNIQVWADSRQWAKLLPDQPSSIAAD